MKPEKVNHKIIAFGAEEGSVDIAVFKSVTTEQEYSISMHEIEENTEDCIDNCLNSFGVNDYKEVWGYEVTNGKIWAYIVADEPLIFVNFTKEGIKDGCD